MKKVVVVVKNYVQTGNAVADSENIYFEGKDIRVINKDDLGVSSASVPVLIVTDEAETLAVFRVWDYWRKIA